MKVIAITGGTGFVGKALAKKLLADNYQLDRYQGSRISWFYKQPPSWYTSCTLNGNL